MKTTKPLEYKFIKDLIWYDGPLLSLGITENNEPVFEIWIDQDNEENYSKYAYVFIKPEDLEPFLKNEKLYYEVLFDSEEIITWKYNKEKGYFDFKKEDKVEHLKEYGPKEDVSLANDIIYFMPHYEEFLKSEQEKIKLKLNK